MMGLDTIYRRDLVPTSPYVDEGHWGPQGQHDCRRWCRGRAFVPQELL